LIGSVSWNKMSWFSCLCFKGTWNCIISCISFQSIKGKVAFTFLTCVRKVMIRMIYWFLMVWFFAVDCTNYARWVSVSHLRYLSVVKWTSRHCQIF
jgi:hypothetical protein